jgi:hypothetical protein
MKKLILLILVCAPVWAQVSDLANKTIGGVPIVVSNSLATVGYPVIVGALPGRVDQTAILGSAVGGTGNGWTKFTGPTTAEKTFSLPDASATLVVGGNNITTTAGRMLIAQGTAATATESTTHTITTIPAATPVLGSMFYGDVTPAWAALAGNITTVQKFLAQTGDGVNSAAPSWQLPPTSGTLTYYLQSTDSALTNPSAIVTIDKQALTPPQTSKTPVDIAHNAAADVVLQSWATDPGFPGITFIPAGTYLLHIHAYRLSGNRAVALYGVFREVTATGVAVGTIGTLTESTPALGAAEAEYTLAMAVGTPYTMALSTSRLVLDLHAVLTGGSNNTTVRTYVGGTADSYISLPSNTVDATNFVPYLGATANLDMGAHTLSAAAGGSVVVGGASLSTAGYPVIVSSAGVVTQTAILGSAVGGTGNGWTKFSGPTTAEKTFSLPDASATLVVGGNNITTTAGRMLIAQGTAGTASESTTHTTSTLVIGAAGLTNVGAIPRVTATGTLGESVIADSGAAVTITQNGVVPFTSLAAGALVNTLYLNTGKVGIGMTNPAQPLDVFAGNAEGIALRYGANASSRNWGFVHDVAAFGDFEIRTSSVQTPGLLDVNRMQFYANGNLDIPTGTLYVYKSQHAVTSLLLDNPDTTTGDYGTQASYQLKVGGQVIGELRSTAKDLTGIAGPSLYLNTIGNYPIAFGVNNSATPSMVLDISGNLSVAGSVTAKSAVWLTEAEAGCAVGTRGRVTYVAGGAGVADTFRMCSKDAADAYAWRSLF